MKQTIFETLSGFWWFLNTYSPVVVNLDFNSMGRYWRLSRRRYKLKRMARLRKLEHKKN